MSSTSMYRLLSSIQCLICIPCRDFKERTGGQVLLFTCGLCRRVISTCAQEALSHVTTYHPDTAINTIDELVQRFGAVYVVFCYNQADERDAQLN